jgi:hypothetical protein
MSEVSRDSLSAVISAVELRDVRLIGANVRTWIRDSSKLSDAHLVINHNTQVIAKSDQAFLVGAMLRVQVVTGPQTEPVKDAKDPAIEMGISFALEYVLPGASTFEDSVLSEFARVNGTFNAWPYWREYVQTTAARMGLPPLVIPVFRVERSKPDSGREAPSDTPRRNEPTSPHRRAIGGKKK